MNNSHISNFGSFGRTLLRFADAHGFVWWADVDGLEALSADELYDISTDWTLDNETRAAAEVESVRRAVKGWREE